MGTTLWQEFLCFLGYFSYLSIHEGSQGLPKPDSNHCCSLVRAVGLGVLSYLGEDRSLCEQSWQLNHCPNLHCYRLWYHYMKASQSFWWWFWLPIFEVGAMFSCFFTVVAYWSKFWTIWVEKHCLDWAISKWNGDCNFLPLMKFYREWNDRKALAF